jgi:hypothetical protein
MAPRHRRRSPEGAIQSAVFAHLRARGAPGIFAFHPANGGYRKPIEAAILKGMGVVAGVPDISRSTTVVALRSSSNPRADALPISNSRPSPRYVKPAPTPRSPKASTARSRSSRVGVCCEDGV